MANINESKDLLGVAPLLESVTRDIAVIKNTVGNSDKVSVESLMEKILHLNLLKFQKKNDSLLKIDHVKARVNQVPIATCETNKSAHESQNHTSLRKGCFTGTPLDEQENVSPQGSGNEFQESKLKRINSEVSDNVILRSNSCNARNNLSSSVAREMETRCLSRNNIFEPKTISVLQKQNDLIKSEANCSKRKKNLMKTVDKLADTNARKNNVPDVNFASSKHLFNGVCKDIHVYLKPKTTLKPLADNINVQHKKCKNRSGSTHTKTQKAKKIFNKAEKIPMTKCDFTNTKGKILQHDNNKIYLPSCSYNDKHTYTIHGIKGKKPLSRSTRGNSRKRCSKSTVGIRRVSNKHKKIRCRTTPSYQLRRLGVSAKPRRGRKPKQRTVKKMSSTCENLLSNFEPRCRTANCDLPPSHGNDLRDEKQVIGTKICPSQGNECVIHAHLQTGTREGVRPVIIDKNKDPRKMCHGLGIRFLDGSSVEGTKHGIVHHYKPPFTSEEKKEATIDALGPYTTAIGSKSNRGGSGIYKNIFACNDQSGLAGSCSHTEKVKFLSSVCQDINNNALPQIQYSPYKSNTKTVLYNERCNPSDSVPALNYISASLIEEKPLRLPLLSTKTRISRFSIDGNRKTCTHMGGTHVSSVSVNTRLRKLPKDNDKIDEIKDDKKTLQELLEELKNNSEVVMNDTENNNSLSMSSLPLTIQNSGFVHSHNSKTKHDTTKSTIFFKSCQISGANNSIEGCSDSKEFIFPSTSSPSLATPHIATRKECDPNAYTEECQEYIIEDERSGTERYLKRNHCLPKLYQLDRLTDTYSGSRFEGFVNTQSVSFKLYDIHQGTRKILVDLSNKTGNTKSEVSPRNAYSSCITFTDDNTNNNNVNGKRDEDKMSQALEQGEATNEVGDISAGARDSFISLHSLTNAAIFEDYLNDDDCQAHHNGDIGCSYRNSNNEFFSIDNLESSVTAAEGGEGLELELLSLIAENTLEETHPEHYCPLHSNCTECVNSSVNNPNRRQLNHRRCAHIHTENNCRQSQARYREHLKRRNIPKLSQEKSSHFLGVYSNSCYPSGKDLKSNELHNIEPVTINTEAPNSLTEHQKRGGNIPLLQEHSTSHPYRDAQENDIARTCRKQVNKGCQWEDSTITCCPTTDNFWETTARERVSNPFQLEDHKNPSCCNMHNSTTCNKCCQQSDSELFPTAARTRHSEQNAADLVNSNTNIVIPAKNNVCNSNFKDLYKHLNSMWEKSESKINQQLRCLNDAVSRHMASLQNLVENKLHINCTRSVNKKGNVRHFPADPDQKHVDETKEHVGTIRLSTKQEKVGGRSHGRSLDLSEYNRKHIQETASDDFYTDDENTSKESSEIMFNTFPTIKFNEITHKGKGNFNNYYSPNESGVRYKHCGSNFLKRVSSRILPNSNGYQINNTNLETSGKAKPKYRPIKYSPQRCRKNENASKNLKRKNRASSSSPRYKSLKLFIEDANNPLRYVFKNKRQNSLCRYRRHKHSRNCRRRHAMNEGICCNKCLPSSPLDLNESPRIKVHRKKNTASNSRKSKREALKHYNHRFKQISQDFCSARFKRVSSTPQSRRFNRISLKPQNPVFNRISLKSQSRTLNHILKPQSRICKRIRSMSCHRRSEWINLESPSLRFKPLCFKPGRLRSRKKPPPRRVTFICPARRKHKYKKMRSPEISRKGKVLSGEFIRNLLRKK